MNRKEMIAYKLELVRKYERYIDECIKELEEYIQLLRNEASDLGFYTGLSDDEYEDEDI